MKIARAAVQPTFDEAWTTGGGGAGAPVPRAPQAPAAPRRARRAGAALALALALALAGAPQAAPAGAGLAAAAHAAERAAAAGWTTAQMAARGAAALDVPPAAAGAPSVRVWYSPRMSAEARLVGNLAARSAPAVFHDLGVRPPARVTVVLEPDQATMNADLHLGSSASPMGAYWRGVVWVLAPSAWLGPDPEGWSAFSAQARTFAHDGPVVHELAHMALDLKVAGRAPAWFDEGVAQWEEARRTGFVWREPANDLDQPLYSYEELSRSFDRLSNVALAYREAYVLVDALSRAQGGHGLQAVLDRMAAGATVDEAAHEVLGAGYADWRGGAPWRAAAAADAAVARAGAGSGAGAQPAAGR
ncbi:MAG: hypothetical protein IMW98_09285 [Firmicutes bacterium]|nr:hypothetical protein [Bacillota bacterium]